MKVKTKKTPPMPIVDTSIQEWKKKLNYFNTIKDDKRKILLLYRDIFDVVPSSTLPLVVLKLQYYIWKKTMTQAEWDTKTDKTKKNYEIAMMLKTNGLSETLKDLVERDIKEEHMANMTVKKKIEGAEKASSNGNGSAHAFARVLGKTLKLGIVQTWAHIFDKEKKWTDEKISEFMKSEFPGRKNKTFDNVSRARYDYNAGRLTNGVPPKAKAVQFEDRREEPADKKVK
jgi:hypothetical protein